MMIATASSRRRDLSIIRRVAVPGLNILTGLCSSLIFNAAAGIPAGENV